MFNHVKHVFLCLAVLLISFKTCTSDLQLPTLTLHSPGAVEYIDVLVKRVHDNLTLVCATLGDNTPRAYVWNYVGNNTPSTFTVSPSGLTNSSQLVKYDLQVTDSGHYMCSSPPFSITKYILVQKRGSTQCARGAFSCEARCVLPSYVCDGKPDCEQGEDEALDICPPQPCQRNDRLNCSTGRCIPEAACCHTADSLCRQDSCCLEHPRYARLDEGDEVLEYTRSEDRHAADDLTFIQSTIYTVTACALIFMIAVVLLVSALCKMHMKRTALRGYAHAHRDTAHHYSARYPPRYESTRLLDLPPLSPTRQPGQCESESVVSTPMCEVTSPVNSGFALSRLGSMFCTRYSQVPTQGDVEMTDVRSSSLNNSPTRNPPLDYRSPIPSSELYYTNPDLTNLGRDLNYMATPIEFFRRRNLRRNTLDRVIDHLTQAPRPLTLQLGRFQLSIPRFNRRDPRPDTPDIAEINIDNLDFVRLNSNDTYTLNGRTIRLLGADFENYPHLDANRPPPYNEAMRYKVYGPPPEYLSREGINRENEATNNVEMPPLYDDLSGQNGNANGTLDNATVAPRCGDATSTSNFTPSSTANNGNDNAIRPRDATQFTAENDAINGNVTSSRTIENLNNNVPETISSVIDNLPAIDSDVNANDTVYNDTVISE